MTSVVASPRLVNVHEAADMLGCSAWSVREYIAAGELPIVRLPTTKGPGTKSRRILISVDDIAAFIQRCRA